MKKYLLFIACLLTMLMPMTAFAAKVTKIVITAVEPVVGEKRSFKASVPSTASTEIYEVHWLGELENGAFVQGNDYTITVKLRIKANSQNIFASSGNINATINGKKAKVSKASEKEISVKYTWKALGGENPNNPKTKLKTKLRDLAASYVATNADDDKVILDYLQTRLPNAEIWLAGGSYRYTRKMPSETEDGRISVSIGITCDGVTLDRYSFSVVLPALNKSPEAAMLAADMELMKTALKNLVVTSRTQGDEVLAVVNAAAVNGTKAVWDKNYTYNAPDADSQGSIEGNIVLTLGNQKDYFLAHKTLPIAGTAADAAIDADFSFLSKALHNCNPTNKTTQEELLKIANASIKNGSKLTFVSFTKTEATYESEGKIVIYFELENKGKSRSPRISMRMPKLRPNLPKGISLNQDEWEILRLTNKERFKRGRKSLVIVGPLQDAADIRAKEIKVDYRKDHLRPDGSSFKTAIDPTFVKHRTCGENALKDTYYPSIAMCGWMHSPGHKANILTEDYSYLGAGVYAVGNDKYWIQLFAGGNDIVSAETNTGSTHFETVVDMEEAYLICTNSKGEKCYVPLDDEYMIKKGNKYTIHLGGLSFSVTVGK